jgi:hypothetical protein
LVLAPTIARSSFVPLRTAPTGMVMSNQRPVADIFGAVDSGEASYAGAVAQVTPFSVHAPVTRWIVPPLGLVSVT